MNTDKNKAFEMESFLSGLRMHWDYEPEERLWPMQTESLRYSRVKLCATREQFRERILDVERRVW